jgi:hypothetical protein
LVSLLQTEVIDLASIKVELAVDVRVSLEVRANDHTRTVFGQHSLYKTSTPSLCAAEGVSLLPGHTMNLPFSLLLPANLPPSSDPPRAGDGHGVTYMLNATVTFPRTGARRIFGSRKRHQPARAEMYVPVQNASTRRACSCAWPSVSREDSLPFFGKGPVSLEVRGPDLLHIGEEARLPLIGTLRLPLLLERHGRPGKLRATVKVKRKRKLRAGGYSRKLSDYPVTQKLTMHVVDAANGLYGVQSHLQLPSDGSLVTLPKCAVLQHETRASITVRYGARKLIKTSFPIAVDPSTLQAPPALGAAAGPSPNTSSSSTGSSGTVASPFPTPVPSAPLRSHGSFHGHASLGSSSVARPSVLLYPDEAPPSYEEATGTSSTA